MNQYTLTHLSDDVLIRALGTILAQDRATTVRLLAHLAEFDVRRLYAAQGFDSMFAYCTQQLHLSENAAYKRIRAARAARRFPSLFSAIAEGRLHLAAVCVLSPHLTEENLDGLVNAATHRRKSEVEELVAARFPGAMPASKACAPSIRAISTIPVTSTVPTEELFTCPGREPSQRVPGPVASEGEVGVPAPESSGSGEENAQLVPGPVVADANASASANANASASDRQKKRYLVRFTIDEETHEKLRRVQALLSHAVPSGDMAQVLARALDSLIVHLEKKKAGVGAAPRAATRPAENVGSKATATRPRSASHYVPARVRRAVWKRDQGRCTFTSAGGHRCETRRFLEFDHVQPVARGGVATIDGIRLRCRAHNQLEAERVFGMEFMHQRQEARKAVAARTASPEMGLGRL